jgi:hypothetical protein
MMQGFWIQSPSIYWRAGRATDQLIGLFTYTPWRRRLDRRSIAPISPVLLFKIAMNLANIRVDQLGRNLNAVEQVTRSA